MNKVTSVIRTHPTRITGFLLVIAGSLQANSAAFQQILTPQQFGIFTIAIGCIVAGLGFVNAGRANVAADRT